ncbi:hypothetical protein HELRODRAFT_160230 [Helobdella robusta]|uniref:Tetraspanin n=1 Tax=Helobdella robusta TaxID=6412 RepID=T1EQ02_HELRO|nr:hypothetical protein HELRODRAFT_160230 [Helobdella robusta]ESO06096.1 hypothetical protein HELRODRAFT_160230 [Helobdella robusta]
MFTNWQDKCCGTHGPSSYQDIKLSKRSQKILFNADFRAVRFPISCCSLNNNVTNVKHEENFRNLTNCLDGDFKYINKKHCLDHVIYYRTYWYGIFFALQILTLAFLLHVNFFCLFYYRNLLEFRDLEKLGV